MDKKEFKGHLEGVSSEKIIKKEINSDFHNFFLILGMVFNDFKGLIIFWRLVQDSYRSPAEGEVSAHSGEYQGLKTQVNKYIISTIVEFLVFLDAYQKSVISTYPFQVLIKKLPKPAKEAWDIVLNAKKGAGNIFSKLYQVRANITSHFDTKDSRLRKGYLDFFIDKNQPGREKAYFSSGRNMEETRFYYSDAAVEGYMNSLLTKEEFEQVGNLIKNMNEAIQVLLREYLISIK